MDQCALCCYKILWFLIGRLLRTFAGDEIHKEDQTEINKLD